MDDETLQVPKQTRHYPNGKSQQILSLQNTLHAYSTSRQELHIPQSTHDNGSSYDSLSNDVLSSENCSTINVEQMYVDVHCIERTESAINDSHSTCIGDSIATTTPSGREQENVLEVQSESSSDSETSSDDESEIYSSTSEDDYSDHDNSCMDEGTIDAATLSSFESACMALLSFITRHRITNEASQDLIELIKVTCPESEVFNSMSIKSMQEICGNCRVNVYDVCEKCLGLFPCEERDVYVCSTPNCGG